MVAAKVAVGCTAVDDEQDIVCARFGAGEVEGLLCAGDVGGVAANGVGSPTIRDAE